MTTSNLQDAAEEKLHTIAQYIISNAAPGKSIGLLDGRMGSALFLLYYSRWSGNKQAEETAHQHIEYVYDVIAGGFAFAPYAAGLAGIASGLLHLYENSLIDLDLEDTLHDLDRYLAQCLLAEEKYSLLNGSSGIAAYFARRLPYNPSRIEPLLNDWLQHCAATAIPAANGICWQSVVRGDYTGVNIGMAHGMAGLLVVLSLLAAPPPGLANAARLLNGAATFIGSQRISSDTHLCCFPVYSLETDLRLAEEIARSRRKSHSRLAWCYGDPGVAFACWLAATRTGQVNMATEALAVLEHSATRKAPADNGIHDACLCHGTTGMAQLFGRLFLHTHNPVFKEAQLYWIQQTLDMAANHAHAGYAIEGYSDNPSSVLEGLSGIGLGLLAFAAKDDWYNRWDEILFLS